MYEGKALSVKDIKDQQLQQLSRLLFPNQPYNFSTLKQEIIRLKYQELATQIRNKRTKFDQLIIDTKSKAGNLERIVDLLLETQKQAIKNDDQLIKGQLIAYQNVLEDSLTKEKLQTLLAKQTELVQLEEHLANFQIGEQSANLQIIEQ